MVVVNQLAGYGAEPSCGWAINLSQSAEGSWPGQTIRQFSILNSAPYALNNVSLTFHLPNKYNGPSSDPEGLSIYPIGSVDMKMEPAENGRATRCIIKPVVGTDQTLGPGHKLDIRFVASKPDWKPNEELSMVSLGGQNNLPIRANSAVPASRTAWQTALITVTVLGLFLVLVTIATSFYLFKKYIPQREQRVRVLLTSAHDAQAKSLQESAERDKVELIAKFDKEKYEREKNYEKAIADAMARGATTANVVQASQEEAVKKLENTAKRIRGGKNRAGGK